MEARAKNVMKEVIKKHQLSPSDFNMFESKNSGKEED
jgi:hypothetical protein